MTIRSRIKEILVVICVSYTLISLGVSLFESVFNNAGMDFLNRLTMLLWTAIAVSILYTHPLLERFSPLTMVLLQYVAAQLLVFLTIWIIGFFVPLHEQGYFHAFRSFTVIYWIGAGVYYIEVVLSVRKQNRMLEEIRKAQH